MDSIDCPENDDADCMNIRAATIADHPALYALGLATPEFQVGAEGPFMEPDEFLSAIENPHGTFLLAEDGQVILGFVYASRQDVERGPRTSWACLVYLVVESAHRKRGVARKLYTACINDLRTHGVRSVYAWANTESDGSIVSFLKKEGYAAGHRYVWMDKDIGIQQDAS